MDIPVMPPPGTDTQASPYQSRQTKETTNNLKQMNVKKKNSIKRAQSQARLSFAERKNFRPMAKILTLLVLLMTAVTGARAAWTGGTYTATANENLNAITVSDDATLTINADVTVTVTGGIVVADGKTLTITGGGTLVANGANGANGGTGQTGNAGGTAIAGNVIINGVGLTVTATGGQGGKGGQGGQGDEGNEGSPGGQGGQGGTGAQGANGGSAFSGAVTIYAGSVTATGGQGGKGGKGGTGGTGGYGSNEYDNGGQGGKGGTGGTGGQGGHAFAGTLTVYGGNVSAYGGQRGMYGNGGDGGDGGDSDLGHSGDPGDTGDDGENGANGYAYANSVTFETATYTVKDNSGYPINLNNITSEQNVIIQSADVELVVTYSVALADGTEDAANWQGKAGEGEYQALPLEGVAAGTAVTVTYTGTKKVIGVKAEKKAAAPRPLAEAVAADLGKIAGADGNIYDTKAAAEAAGTTAVAMIAYVGSETGHATYTHGLAIALADEGSMNWSTAESSCEGKSAVTNAAWLMPSQNQWKAMFKAFGDNDASYSGLNTAITTAGGDDSKLQVGKYWTSTLFYGGTAYNVDLGSNGNASPHLESMDYSYQVRACLAF